MKALLSVILIFASAAVCGQQYLVSRVKGEIYCKKVLVKSGDKLDELSSLVSGDRRAMLRVVNGQQGSFIITFENGRPSNNHVENEHSEIFELLIGDYIERYKKYRSLSVKGVGSNDWFECVATASADSLNCRILFVDGEGVPTLTKTFSPTRKFQLYLSVYEGKDARPLQRVPMRRDSIYFNKSLFGTTGEGVSFQLQLAEAGKSTNSKMMPINDRNIIGKSMTRAEISLLVEDAKRMVMDPSFEIPNKGKELYDFFLFNYGHFFSPFIERILTDY